MKIGFFDSGKGGLLIAEAVRAQLPQYDYVYYGDTAHVPYGGRAEREIYELTRLGVEHLFETGCSVVVLACNTASAETLRKLQDEWLGEAYPGRKILGVIIPTIEAVIEAKCTRVLMLGTARTVSAGKYHLELGKRNELHTKIIAEATPGLVPLIEAGDISAAVEEAASILDTMLARGEEIDGLILGCTHYSLLAGELQKRYPQIQIFTQTEVIPEKLTAYLGAHSELADALSTGGTLETFFTGHTHGGGE